MTWSTRIQLAGLLAASAVGIANGHVVWVILALASIVYGLGHGWQLGQAFERERWLARLRRKQVQGG